MSEQLELIEIEQTYTKPENYDPNAKYTLYQFGDNRIHIANSWSRKSVSRTMDKSNDDGLLWSLNNKCEYLLYNEFDQPFSNFEDNKNDQLTEESIEDLPIDTIAWLNEIMVNHVGFLVGILTQKKKPK
jgi:hypothetical protein